MSHIKIVLINIIKGIIKAPQPLHNKERKFLPLIRGGIGGVIKNKQITTALLLHLRIHHRIYETDRYLKSSKTILCLHHYAEPWRFQ